MIRKSIEELAKIVEAKNDCTAFMDKGIAGVSINSKSINAGNLFIPLKGETRDGHEFVEMAIEQGAHASLWQADQPNPPLDLPILIVDDTLKAMQKLAKTYRQELNIKVAAVTGSNGKTTTKDILAELLAVKYKVQKTMGNYNNHLGLPLTILALEEDTEVAVLEMGMNHFGEIDLLTTIAQPDAAIITNIGEAHLQELGSRKGIAKAKMEILNGLKAGGLFVYPGEEPLIQERLVTMEPKWEYKTFGKSAINDLYPTSLSMTQSSSLFEIPLSKDTFELPVLGEYNVLNALAAMLVAAQWGVPFHRMNEGFSRLQLTHMRMEMTKGMKGSTILNDAYNASPTSMKAVLNLISNLDGYTKKIAVLGDMLELGPNEAAFHQEMAHYLNPEKIDLVYAYGNLSQHMIETARTAYGETKALFFDDKQSLITHLKDELEEGTLVLVKASRGMKMEEVVHAILE